MGQHDVTSMEKELIECGSNGGIWGDNMRVIDGIERFVDITFLDGHNFSQLYIVSVQ
jgi:hypothetical protein